jgi:hypothetical protein
VRSSGQPERDPDGGTGRCSVAWITPPRACVLLTATAAYGNVRRGLPRGDDNNDDGLLVRAPAVLKSQHLEKNEGAGDPAPAGRDALSLRPAAQPATGALSGYAF